MNVMLVIPSGLVLCTQDLSDCKPEVVSTVKHNQY